MSERRSLETIMHNAAFRLGDARRELSEAADYLLRYDHLMEANPGLKVYLLDTHDILAFYEQELEEYEVKS